MPQYVPEGFHRVTPMLIFSDARQSIEFYKQEFDAKERFVMPGPDGKGVMPCRDPDRQLDSHDGGRAPSEPWHQAQLPACRSRTCSGGDRVGTVQDPYGYGSSPATHTKGVSTQELQEGAKAAFAKMAGNKKEEVSHGVC